MTTPLPVSLAPPVVHNADIGAAQTLSVMGVGSMSPQQSTTPEANSWRAVTSESMASRRAMIRSASWRLTRLRALTSTTAMADRLVDRNTKSISPSGQAAADLPALLERRRS